MYNSWVQSKYSSLTLDLLVQESTMDYLTQDEFKWFRKFRIKRLAKQIEETKMMKRFFEVVLKGLALNSGKLVFYTQGVDADLPEKQKLRALGFYMSKRVPDDENGKEAAAKCRWRWEFNL